MTIQLFNTTERRIVPFEPLIPGKVSLYCCGPTVYSYAHIGNLRTYIFEDVLTRTLEYFGFSVRHVMNITDVGHLTSDGDEGEDKMIKASRERGMTVWDIAQFFTDAFFQDTDLLGVRRPTVVCRATEHIQEMIALVQLLEQRGLTYHEGGNVYFDTTKLASYGKMAKLENEELQAGARIQIDKVKKHPRDFVLWFTQSKFEHQAMLWDSPWGMGYPGWHLECSAMSMKYLGERFDIHCGGVDHIKVHHTNEIAQSEGATGKKWVNYWLHAAFLLVSYEKMSKSKGKFLTLSALKEQGYDPLDFRFFCLGAHYRHPLTFSFKALDAARIARIKLLDRVAAWNKTSQAAYLTKAGQVYKERWKKALAYDLATPGALAVLWALIKDVKLSPEEKLTLVNEMDRVLGLRLSEVAPLAEQIPSKEVLSLMDRYIHARKNKEFSLSDQWRAELKSLGWQVEDGPAGSKLRRLAPKHEK